jgi:hypothetical protein
MSNIDNNTTNEDGYTPAPIDDESGFDDQLGQAGPPPAIAVEEKPVEESKEEPTPIEDPGSKITLDPV